MTDFQTRMRQFRLAPRNDGVAARKEDLAAINDFVTARNGFVTVATRCARSGDRMLAWLDLAGGVAGTVRLQRHHGRRGRAHPGRCSHRAVCAPRRWRA